MLGRWLLLQPVERRWVPIEEVAPIAWQSIIMSEDGQFCSHHGVDLRELNAVIDDAMEGEKTRGASTITMQLAKNLFLWNGRSFLRKVMELPLAIYLDIVLPKQRIMEIYLNIAEWDTGVFGIEAAAQHYFKRPASQLSARQAALLAVTLPAAGGRDPSKPGAGCSGWPASSNGALRVPAAIPAASARKICAPRLLKPACRMYKPRNHSGPSGWKALHVRNSGQSFRLIEAPYSAA